MLIHEPSWIRLVLRVHHSELGTVGPRVLAFLALSLVVTYAHEVGYLGARITSTPFTLLALPLGVFLGFRANRAHDRYWEARTQWGNLVNVARTFSRQVWYVVGAGVESAPEDLDALRRRLVFRVIGFVYALRAHLQDDLVPPTAAPFLPTDEVDALERERNVPAAVLRSVTADLARALRAQWLHPMHLPDIEQAVSRMTDVQGACERIKNTPLPMPYTGLTHRLVAVYCVGLPFGLVESLGWLTPVFVSMIAYVFLGLDGIASVVEHPFAKGPNQLPLQTLCRTIELNLRQTMGQTEDLPTVPRPSDGVQP